MSDDFDLRFTFAGGNDGALIVLGNSAGFEALRRVIPHARAHDHGKKDREFFTAQIFDCPGPDAMEQLARAIQKSVPTLRIVTRVADYRLH